jgi:YD repeat-containing protein
MANYTVSRKSTHEWRVTRDGAERPSEITSTQQQAERVAKELAGSSGGGEVRIKGLNGKIRDSDTVAPGNDPCPPRDRKH